MSVPQDPRRVGQVTHGTQRKRATGTRPETSPRRRLRIMPLTLTMLSLLFVLKAGDVYFDTQALHEALSIREASAADAAPADAAKTDRRRQA